MGIASRTRSGGSKRKAPYGGSKRKAPYGESSAIVYVNFSIMGLDGRQLFFRVNEDVMLYRAFKVYCQRLNLEYDTLRFLLDGSYVNGKRQTPKMLNLKNGDEILAVSQP